METQNKSKKQNDTISPLTPVVPDENTREFAVDLLKNFGDFHLVNSKTGQHVATEGVVFDFLKDILRSLSLGKAVSIVPHDAELTTHQSAQLLNVSRPFLISLLENGDIPFHKVGTHRRVRYEDILNYKLKQKEQTSKSLSELTQLSQEYGLY